MKQIKLLSKLKKQIGLQATMLSLIALTLLLAQAFSQNGIIVADEGDRKPTPVAVESGEIGLDVAGSGTLSNTVFLPLHYTSLETPALLSISLPAPVDGQYWSSQIVATWSAVNGAMGYEVEESKTSTFTDSNIYNIELNNSLTISHATTYSNVPYYYRVRALGDTHNSTWSNVRHQTFIYQDHFHSPASGWDVRRQDYDDVNQLTFYEGGYLKMKIHGRWDSMISSPLTTIPDTWGSYRIDTRAILEDGIDNLHSYGIVFGGDYDLQNCPNELWQGCFKHYYRLNIIWFGNLSLFKMELKRIDYHNYDTGKDIGETLVGWKDVRTSRGTDNWNNWSIEVHEDGLIRIYLNGRSVATATDSHYNGSGYYFGTFASSNEYSGTAAWYDYYRVVPLP